MYFYSTSIPLSLDVTTAPSSLTPIARSPSFPFGARSTQLGSSLSTSDGSVETDRDDRTVGRDWERLGEIRRIRGIGLRRIRGRRWDVGERDLGAGDEDHLLALDFSLALSHR